MYVDKQKCTTVMGGVVAWPTGGVFLQGAMQGMMIGAGILHGRGTPFKISFNGLYHNK